MHDLGAYFAILLGLWALEGWTRIPREAWVFRRTRGRWRLEGAHGRLGGGGAAWAWLPPWLGGGRLLVARGWPQTPATAGLWLGSSQAPIPGRPFPQDDLRLPWDPPPSLSRKGDRLLHGGAPLGEPRDPAWLQAWIQDLRALAATAPEARPAALDAWARRRLDPAPCRRRLRRLLRLTAPLQRGIAVHALWLFLLAPLLIVRFGWLQAWPFLLVTTLALQIALGTLATRAHRLLLPERAEDRLPWALSCYLSPAPLLRACEDLAAKATSPFHPATLALALGQLGLAPGQELLAPILRDLRHPCQPLAEGGGEALEALDREHRERIVAAIGTFHPGAAEVPAGAGATCPRCGEDYIHGGPTCADCGVPLLPPATRGPAPGPGACGEPRPPC